MDLNIFATQTIQKDQTLLGSTNLLLGAQDESADGDINSLAFWNSILGNLAETPTKEELQKNININLASNNNQASDDAIGKQAIKQEKIDLALLQIALLGQDADQTLEQKLAELRIERIVNNPENRVEQLTKLIDHLTSGLPSLQLDGNDSVIDLVSRLTQRLEKLEASLDAFRSGDFGTDGAPFQALIATGLNPSQLTGITSRIEEIETKLGRELTVEDLIAGVGNIIPVPGQKNVDGGIQHTTDTSDEYTQINLNTAPKENKDSVIDSAGVGIISASNATLNNQIIAAQNARKEAQVTNNVAPPTTSAQTQQNQTSSHTTGEKPLSQMSNAEFNALFKGHNNIGNDTGVNKKQSNGNQIAHAVKSMSSLPSLANTGDIQLSGNWSSSLFMNNVLSDLAGLDIQTGTPFNNVMQAVNHVTAATAQPGKSHPATSMVAATISKAAREADSRQVTLQLDPPELGRVEIRLEFGADKKVQAHLVIEKPETYLMLQRDMSALEKSLQDSGLDTSGDSINYEMASEDYNFNSNRDGNAQNGGKGSSGSNGEEGEDVMTIETTMSWNVDPETGHVHYNILA